METSPRQNSDRTARYKYPPSRGPGVKGMDPCSPGQVFPVSAEKTLERSGGRRRDLAMGGVCSPSDEKALYSLALGSQPVFLSEEDVVLKWCWTKMELWSLHIGSLEKGHIKWPLTTDAKFGKIFVFCRMPVMNIHCRTERHLKFQRSKFAFKKEVQSSYVH